MLSGIGTGLQLLHLAVAQSTTAHAITWACEQLTTLLVCLAETACYCTEHDRTCYHLALEAYIQHIPH